VTAFIVAGLFFLCSILGIGILMYRAYLNGRPAMQLSYGTAIYLHDGISPYAGEIESQIEDLLRGLHNAQLLDINKAKEHVAEMSIHLYPPKGANGGVTDPSTGRLLEGITENQWQIHVTWKAPPNRTALRYEMINALTWKFEGADFAHDEGSEARQPWDRFQ